LPGTAGALFGVAIGVPGPDGIDLLTQRLVAGGGAQRAAQVVPGGGEQAGVQLAVGRQPGAGEPRQNGWVTEAITPISPAPSR
jgi:hypothetical protein